MKAHRAADQRDSSAARKISIISAAGRRRSVSLLISSNSAASALAQTAAEHAAVMIEVVEQIARAGQYRTGGGIEVFVQGHIDGVEQASVGLRPYSGVGRRQEQSGPVEMQSDPALTREGGDALHL